MAKRKFDIDDVVEINTQDENGYTLVGKIYSVEKAFDTFFYGIIISPESITSYTIKQVQEKKLQLVEEEICETCGEPSRICGYSNS